MPSRSIIRTGVGPHREPRNRFPAMAAAINLLAARAAPVQSRRNPSRSLSPKLDHFHSITRFDRSRTGPYYLLSTALSAARFGEVARAHWGVENGLHWVLDVTMNEDQARNHKDHGPQNIALLRRLALNLAKLEGSRESLKSKLFRAAL